MRLSSWVNVKIKNRRKFRFVRNICESKISGNSTLRCPTEAVKKVETTARKFSELLFGRLPFWGVMEGDD